MMDWVANFLMLPAVKFRPHGTNDSEDGEQSKMKVCIVVDKVYKIFIIYFVPMKLP